jgi:hypothetical protein
MKHEINDGLREQRRERSAAIEDEIHGIFRDEAQPIEQRATESLARITGKLVDDVEAQFSHVCCLKDEPSHSSSYLDQEVCRLLRMLEKRQAMIATLEEALELAGTLVVEIAS